MKPALDLRKLRAFVAVAEERHFGRAAERLFVAQPALSQTIKALEASIGVQLLDRSTRRVDLTLAGARLLDRARDILGSVDDAVAEARRIDAGEEGSLRLGFIGSASFGLMPSLARALGDELPRLRLDLTGDLLSPEVAARLADGSLDVGILRPFALSPGVHSRVLHSEPLVAALPSGHPATDGPIVLADLAEEPFVSYLSRASAMASALTDACRAAGFTPTIRTEVRETATLVAFVASGLGVALVPQGVAHLQIPGVEYVGLADEVTIDLVAGWRSDAPATVERVVDRLETLATGTSTA
ncbi:LysR family transcriptional regulator [Propioniciclava sinopodophylli]|uniref:LysR family transcriptional regulator n=1 Tax=Propioniciclava sinopodophylli TaxID=1837344 RepID=A0A4Q9KEP2_9ACTN|nr:LysR substrate-binding domain-containing protein [Propioniciclava sinopodophylli]TBT85914.1 LysR family transcriptional regulator [Propioniciclava sinopodophylli]